MADLSVPNTHGEWLTRGDTPEYRAYIREVTEQPDLPDDDERFRDTDPFVTCTFCGGLHPDDLLRAIDLGAKVGGSDWKYGYPHKFYIDWPNPEPDKLFAISRLSKGATPETFGYSRDWYEWREEDGRWVGYGKRATLHAKFYTEHLIGWLNDLRAKRIEQATGIHFEDRGSGGLFYRAPHHGYQR